MANPFFIEGFYKSIIIQFYAISIENRLPIKFISAGQKPHQCSRKALFEEKKTCQPNSINLWKSQQLIRVFFCSIPCKLS